MSSIINAATSGGLISSGDTSGILKLQTASTDAITIDASQNVGIGTSSPTQKLFVSAADPRAILSSTGTGHSVWQCTNTSGSSYFGRDNAGGSFFGTANTTAIYTGSATPITFYTNATERMRLDSSGNLGVGTSSPSTYGRIVSSNTGTDTNFALVNTSSVSASNTVSTDYYLGDSNTGLSKVAIIGVINPSAAANRYGNIYFSTSSAGAPAERMRLNSSGNLLVGTTSANGKITVIESIEPTVSQTVYFENTSSSFTKRVLSLNATRNTTNGTYKFLSCSISAVAEKFYVFDSGSVYNATGTYGTISDVKLKENIVDATPKLDDVMQLQVRNFNFKSIPEEKQIGFVAQEIEQVFPAMVQETVDRDEEGNEIGETTKQVKTTVLIPILVKAIQELKEIVDTQAAKIAALEAKCQ
jgi:hypothetical protein